MIRRMKQTIGKLGVIALALGSVSLYTMDGQQMPAEYDQAMKILGKQGDFKDNVLKINIPRNDLKVTIDGIATPTSFGFGGWLAMTKGDRGMDVMMGDLVLGHALEEIEVLAPAVPRTRTHQRREAVVR